MSEKRYHVDNGPLTIGNIPPARSFLDDNDTIQRVPAGTVWFNAKGEYSTADPDQQKALEAHPAVMTEAEWFAKHPELKARTA